MPERRENYDGVKVFSATMADRREKLGESVTAWLASHPELAPVDTVVLLSSDNRFHCLTIVLFWRIVNVQATSDLGVGTDKAPAGTSLPLVAARVKPRKRVGGAPSSRGR